MAGTVRNNAYNNRDMRQPGVSEGGSEKYSKNPNGRSLGRHPARGAVRAVTPLYRIVTVRAG
jgi:hypothetical protein